MAHVPQFLMQSVVALSRPRVLTVQYAHRVVLAAAAGDMGQGKAAGRILLLSSQFGQSPKTAAPTFLVSYKGYVNLALQLCALGRSGKARM